MAKLTPCPGTKNFSNLSADQRGKDDFISDYSEDDLSFLSSIGYNPRDLSDFVEDLADEGAPTESTALLIASVRRDYFLIVQNRTASQWGPPG